MTTTDPGYVYALTHPAHPGWVKVGKAQDLKRRLGSYNTGCPQRSYRYVHTVPVLYRAAAEGEAHIRLEAMGFPPRGEWFNAPDEVVIHVLNNLEIKGV